MQAKSLYFTYEKINEFVYLSRFRIACQLTGTYNQRLHIRTCSRTASRLSMPIMLALFLQALYRALALLIVGKYAFAQDVSGVAEGSLACILFYRRVK